VGWTEQQSLAQSLRAEEAGHDYFEEGLEAVEGRMAELRGTEQRRAQIEKNLGSDVQLDHGGIQDWQADEGPGYRIALQRLANGPRIAGQGAIKREANKLFKESYKAAATGDYAKADELRAQAMEAGGALIEGGGFELGEQFKQKKMKGYKALMSESGLMAGGILRDAGELMDRDSETTERFMDSLTSGALAEINAAETNAGRALATQERSAVRSNRDAAMATGGARSFGSEVALAARSAERFAGMRAQTATEAGAARAQVHAQAAQFYENASRTWAVSALQASRDFINDLSFVRDTYNQMQNDLTGMFAQLAGTAGAASMALSSKAMSTAGSIANADRMAAAQEEAAESEMIGSIVGGVLGIVAMFL
jgi:putative component of toxin-antitoxin plasmid stabilization module